MDNAHIHAHGGIPLETADGRVAGSNEIIPLQLLDGGDHSDDTSRAVRRQAERAGANNSFDERLPRDKLHEVICRLELKRPKPAAWRGART